MKGQWKRAWQGMTILFATAALGLAQTNGPMQGRTMPPPGALNYLEGQVSINGQNLSSSSVRSTVVQPGQTIDTGQGYAEVLLTPGAFLRIGHNSEVRMASAGLVDVKLAVVRGSAMIEAAQLVKGTGMTVTMDRGTTQIEKKGLYDFDANQQSVQVLDGQAKVAEGDRSVTLKKGNEVSLASANPLKKSDFNTKSAQTDPLYVWSKVRSEDESAANINVANNFAAYGGSYGPGWYWDPYWSFYAFMPGSGLLYSPFGWGFYSPGFAYAAPYGAYGYFGHGYYGHGHWGHGDYAHAYHGGAFHGSMGGAHAAGGFRGGMGHGGMGGGFHGGGGSHGGGHGR